MCIRDRVSDTVLAPNGQAFRRAVLVQYPRAGSWTIAFVTGTPSGEVAERLPGDHISVYVPTTPNPTSGFFLMVPRADTVDPAVSYTHLDVYKRQGSCRSGRKEASRRPPIGQIKTRPHYAC